MVLNVKIVLYQNEYKGVRRRRQGRERGGHSVRVRMVSSGNGSV